MSNTEPKCSYRRTAPMLWIQINLPQLTRVERVKIDSPVGKVIDCVMRYICVSNASLFGKTKNYNAVKARHIVMYMCSKYLGMTKIDIGRFFKRDHSTIIHAIRSVENQCQYDQEYRTLFTRIVNDYKKSDI